MCQEGMLATRQICVGPAKRCLDGVYRYRITVAGSKRAVVVKRFSEFRAFDGKLEGLAAKPELPTQGMVGVLNRLHLAEFSEFRRAGLESYLRRLCETHGGGVLREFLAVTEAELRRKSVEELQLYSAAELRAYGFNAVQLRARGRKAASLLAAGFRLEELSDAGYNVGTLWF